MGKDFQPGYTRQDINRMSAWSGIPSGATEGMLTGLPLADEKSVPGFIINTRSTQVVAKALAEKSLGSLISNGDRLQIGVCDGSPNRQILVEPSDPEYGHEVLMISVGKIKEPRLAEQMARVYFKNPTHPKYRRVHKNVVTMDLHDGSFLDPHFDLRDINAAIATREMIAHLWAECEGEEHAPKKLVLEGVISYGNDPENDERRRVIYQDAGYETYPAGKVVIARKVLRNKLHPTDWPLDQLEYYHGYGMFKESIEGLVQAVGSETAIKEKGNSQIGSSFDGDKDIYIATKDRLGTNHLTLQLGKRNKGEIAGAQITVAMDFPRDSSKSEAARINLSDWLLVQPGFPNADMQAMLATQELIAKIWAGKDGHEACPQKLEMSGQISNEEFRDEDKDKIAAFEGMGYTITSDGDKIIATKTLYDLSSTSRT